jgi:hypothetical protein
LFAATFCSAAEARGTIEEDIAVTIPPDIEAQILRYYHAERWRVGTIATVARVLAQAGLPRIERLRRSIDNLAWIWVFEKGQKRADGTAIPNMHIGLVGALRRLRANVSARVLF